MKQIFATKRGYSLIEVLIAAAIFAGIVTLTIGSFSQTLNFNSSVDQASTLRQTASVTMDYLIRAVQRAETQSIFAYNGNGTTDPTSVCVFTYADHTATSCPAYPYYGYGYVLIDGVNANNQFIFADPAIARPNSGILIPVVPIQTPIYSNEWIEILPTGSVPGSAVMRIGYFLDNNGNKLQPGIVGSPSNFNQISSVSGLAINVQWLPSGVNIASLTFFGNDPQSINFTQSGSGGASGTLPNMAYNGSVSQPYLTVTIQLYLTSNSGTIYTYQTTLANNNYQITFPSCTFQNGPGGNCT